MFESEYRLFSHSYGPVTCYLNAHREAKIHDYRDNLIHKKANSLLICKDTIPIASRDMDSVPEGAFDLTAVKATL